MKRILTSIGAAIYFAFGFPVSAQVKHVVLISIDGFHPDMYLDKSWAAPNLRYLMQQGTYAEYLKSVFPSFTYPSHTAMVSGALPARSKINYNQPIGSKGEWFWYDSSIKVPTLWTVLKAKGISTAAIMWPVTVGAPIDYSISELWDIKKPGDRITVARKFTNPQGIVEEFEQHATGKLDSTNMDESHFSMDENCGRMAAYLIQRYKPGFLALHVISCDENEHDFGRDADSVRLALEADDRVVGDVLEAIGKAGLKDSTAVIIVGDHGFSDIHEVFRPNMLIKDLPARFVPSGGSAFLYMRPDTGQNVSAVVKQVRQRLEGIPADKRKLFRMIDRAELDKMGVDSAAVMALAATPGLVFSGAIAPAPQKNLGAGTLIQQNPHEGLFAPVHGGHHGYDPNLPEMHTGFIAAGAGIRKGGRIEWLSEPDIAPLIATLLGVPFSCPDGKLIPGILDK